ncbi:MAG: sigma 54-interacting transcriptional regulator [Melioribacteraceae bacterium]|nr:sigma 54-interacting transcriptional regulator [Melioribacteraceae bacterium]
MDELRIKKLLIEDKAEEALKVINEELNRKFDFQNQNDFEVYNKLVSYRITANTFLGTHDDVVNSVTRKEKYPNEVTIDFDGELAVKLVDKNIFLIKADVIINSLHETKYFNYNPRSLSEGFIEKLGNDFINKQINKQKPNEGLERNYHYILEHTQLNSPISLHLPVIKNEYNSIDLKKLEETLFLAFEYCQKNNFNKIAIGALGFESMNVLKDFHEIVESIISGIKLFILKKKSSYQPVIIFSFVQYDTFRKFEKVLSESTIRGRLIKQINEEQDRIITEIENKFPTKNPDFSKLLIQMGNYVNEKIPVLMMGESGVGKTYLTEEIFYNLRTKTQSTDKNLKGSFVDVNCGVISPERQYQEIFGWVKGAFTGSINDGMSVFEKAGNGLVFLDEIHHLPIDVQAALLKFLDKGTYIKLGSKDELKSNARLVFGTNQNLEELVTKGRMLPDFYERIGNTKKFVIPPLRERKEDIRIFVNNKLKSFYKDHKIEFTVKEDAYKQLEKYNWPGNYRQIQFYLETLFLDKKHKGEYLIAEKDILEYPPRETTLELKSEYDLETILLKELSEWDHIKNGKFVDNYLLPITAKLYLTDLSGKFRKSDSNSILGIDGQRKDSALDRFFKVYKKINNIE